MADDQFSWDDLATYKAEGRFLDGYPGDERTFFAPRDNVHGLLADEHVYVQMSLDRSQSTGAHERAILASWSNDSFGNSIAIGTSSVHNAISHLKIVIVDGVYTVKGSTNWSLRASSSKTMNSP
jgi:phosphatidylserine/phosphatidylglycerophosphate/cardiolipin synthase-like enzyme